MRNTSVVSSLLFFALLLIVQPAMAETKPTIQIKLPKAGVSAKVTLTGKMKRDTHLRLGMRSMATGNSAVVCSTRPFSCYTNGFDLKNQGWQPWEATKGEKSDTSDVPRYLKGWYSCDIDMHGRDRPGKWWEYHVIPSANEQDFVIVTYWSEED